MSKTWEKKDVTRKPITKPNGDGKTAKVERTPDCAKLRRKVVRKDRHLAKNNLRVEVRFSGPVRRTFVSDINDIVADVLTDMVVESMPKKVWHVRCARVTSKGINFYRVK